jgi:hypothetical protein
VILEFWTIFSHNSKIIEPSAAAGFARQQGWAVRPRGPLADERVRGNQGYLDGLAVRCLVGDGVTFAGTGQSLTEW